MTKQHDDKKHEVTDRPKDNNMNKNKRNTTPQNDNDKPLRGEGDGPARLEPAGGGPARVTWPSLEFEMAMIDAGYDDDTSDALRIALMQRMREEEDDVPLAFRVPEELATEDDRDVGPLAPADARGPAMDSKPAEEEALEVDVRVTEIDLGTAMADELVGKAHFLADQNAWVLWDGSVWAKDTDRKIRDTTRTWLRTRMLQAIDSGDAASSQMIKSRSTGGGIGAVLRHAAEDRRIVSRSSAFDTQAHLLCAANGTVDLRSGELLPHAPDLMQMRRSNVTYDPDARSDAWEKIVDHLFPDLETRAYVQRCLGYSSCGENDSDVIFLLVGPPRSGKSTLMQAVKAALGPYYGDGRIRTFCSGRAAGANAARSDLVQHVGCRLVVASEIDPGRKFDAGLLKALSGGEGRGLQLRSEYNPSSPMNWEAKLWFVANDGDLPAARPEDAGFWERVRRLPLGGTIPERERDQKLRGLLASDPATRSAVLTWLVRGAIAYYAGGLGAPPQAVRDAGAALRTEMESPAVDWIREASVPDPQAITVKAHLYAAYKQAAHDNGEKVLSARALIPLLRAEMARGGHPLSETKITKLHAWKGLRLRDDRLDGSAE